MTPRGYEATVTVTDGKESQLWGITHDALLWQRPLDTPR
jgi:hypothetical protein